MSFVKKWHDFTLYPNEDDNFQALNVGTRAEFANSSTLVGRAEKTLPTGYTDRGADFYNGGAWEVHVEKQSGNTYRYTSKVAATGLDAVHSPTLTSLLSDGDRVQIWKGGTDGFAYENLGDFAVTDYGDNWFEISNSVGKSQIDVALESASDIIFYSPTGDENDGLNYTFKNIILNSDREAFRVKIAPPSARFLRFRLENVFSTQKLALAGYTIRYGLAANKGLDR